MTLLLLQLEVREIAKEETLAFNCLSIAASPGAAGYDLHTPNDYVLRAQSKLVIPTGIEVRMPLNTYGRIAPRSGLAVRSMVTTGGGVIDSDYTGQIFVILFNHGTEDVEFHRRDRVAQIICEKVAHPEWIECLNFPETVRGAQGFGASGI